MSTLPALAGLSEVADILGVRTRQRAWQLTRSPGFPAPVTVLAATPVWLAEEVETWQLQRRKRKEQT